MPAARKPSAILIVHGGYFLPTSWANFIKDLTQAGFTVRCPRLPTCGDERPPKALLEDDVAAVRKEAFELVDLGHTILVLAHSYGGVVATQAIASDLYASTSSDRGGVVSLVYLSAWLIQPDDTVAGVIAKYGLQSDVDLGNNNDGTVFAKNAPVSFYNDIEPAQAEDLAKTNVTHNWMAVSGSVTLAPWKDLPTVYIYCLQDRAIKLPLQEHMVEDITTLGSHALETKTVDSGHCPFLSEPQRLLQTIKEVVASIE
ncbi:hypothetical protein MGYG_00728 [Paecilomyces variotii No. 5]|uniref:AB hydrolase-1 domain-containing protein n=1 Tax=Byssochlamys spectabilis (strain No. 5 / NBRC 109023) TaxID=1356009 RepID=V5FIR5_BYSSN|nr:hypothetical protein MGYG_00728 [Paecilomyces variotii No. 5]